MDSPDPSEEPNLTGTPWSPGEDQDIRLGLDHNRSIEEIADFLCRTPSEVRQRIGEIAEADAIGDPSLLRDGLTRRDRIALETYRDARAAMALIREAVEDCAPPGSMAREDYLTPVHSAGRGARPRHLSYRWTVWPRSARAATCSVKPRRYRARHPSTHHGTPKRVA
jgi:hypothetical protein